MEFAARGETAPTEERVRWRRNDAYAAKLCLQAVERLHALAGARRLAASDPFQRHWRDAHAAAAQISLSWDLQAANSPGCSACRPAIREFSSRRIRRPPDT
jgi:hypothetical protein